MSDNCDSDSDSVEEIITVRQLPVPRLRTVQTAKAFMKQCNESDSGRGSDEKRVFETKQRSSLELSETFKEASAHFPAIVSLNVGGHIYMTRLTTLLKYSDSMLAAMFSGRHNMDQDRSGNFFLDSNGLVFAHILEYLRNGSLPAKEHTLAVYRDANYYGLSELLDRLSLRPEIATMTVKASQRAQFPNYAEVRELVVRTAIANASINRVGEVNIYAFKKEFVPKNHNFNSDHACVTDSAHIMVGPWSGVADEDNFIRCLETDLMEDGYNVKPHETKRKCRYYAGQTCQKFIYRISIVFE